MPPLRKYFQLAPTERFILVQAWILLAIAALTLRLLPCKTLFTPSPKDFPSSLPPLFVVPPVPRLAWLVEVAGRYSPLNATCLQQALVLAWLLAMRGIPTEVRIGVLRRERTLTAHAWLEYQGTALLEPEQSQFAPLVRPR
jgi:hypothetical protein